MSYIKRKYEDIIEDFENGMSIVDISKKNKVSVQFVKDAIELFESTEEP